MAVAQDAQHKWRTQSKARRREARQLEREERMKQGTEVTKSAFTSQRRSNVRWLMLSEDGNELCWGASRKGKKKRVRVRTKCAEHSVGSASLRWFAQVADISRVSFGRHSEVFQRQWGGASAPVAAPPPWRSFSVHLPGALSATQPLDAASRRSLSTQP